jgi:ABC-2 type transport system ATP-binding protein
MIAAQNLTKRYVDTHAVEDLTFDVKAGEILGFLGPNGAGKTTTMRMLTGFLAPTSGSAEVAGFDVEEESLEVRKRVGYLPENIPLYPEMRVCEYLTYRAALKRVPRAARRKSVARVVELCGLGDEQRRVVGTLSKGFRQRVGLADALIHEPPILILDEPTVGLDPNQIREVRQLIRELGKSHTILLSTHILPEVEMLCGRVAIINRGKLVAQDSPDRLRERLRGGARILAEVRGPEPEVQEAMEKLPGVSSVASRRVGDACEIEIKVEGSADPREDLFRAVVAHGWVLTGLRREELSLEDIFVRITTDEEDEAKPDEAKPEPEPEPQKGEA